MSWVEVVDDAVKIGLGAIISWLATYSVMKQTRAEDRQKILYTRKLDSLERVSNEAEEHFDSWRGLASKLGGIYSGRHPPNPNFSDQQWESVEKRDKQLLGSGVSLGHAIARLRLLSATEAATCLKEYAKLVGEFRDTMMLQKKTPTKDEFQRTRDKVSECIKTFHHAMSTTYLGND